MAAHPQSRTQRVGSVRLVVSGYYGFANLGDEAVLAGLLSAFEERASVQRSAFTVLSAAPEETSRTHGVGAAPRMQLGAVRAALRDADLLVSGGGSLLQDATSLKSLFYYLAVMRLATSMGKPFVVSAQGIGPLRRPVARIATRLTLIRAASITVRDKDSAALLARIGVARPSVEVTADPVFALPPPDADRGRRILAQAGVSGGQPVGLALRRWAGAETLAAAAAEAATTIRHSGGPPVALLPMHRPDDEELADEVAARSGGAAVVLRGPLGVDDARSVVAALDVVVGMRLHALIFAAAAAVPAAALSYDPKVASFMQDTGQSSMNLPLEALSTAQIVERVDAARRDRGERARELAELRDRLGERALATVDAAMTALDGRP